jgi:hypothetical protein
VIAGLIIFFAGAVMEHALSYAPNSRLAWLLEHLGIGAVVAYLIAFYERRNRTVVLLMNHHVRNALQVIVNALHASGRFDQPAMEAVARIEWALRDVLTGRTAASAGAVVQVHGQAQVSSKR